jgi:hypothetical protein
VALILPATPAGYNATDQASLRAALQQADLQNWKVSQNATQIVRPSGASSSLLLPDVLASFATPEYFGAKAGTSTSLNNTAAFNAGLAASFPLWLTGGKTYRIGSSILPALDGAAILGDGTCTLLMGAEFDNANSAGAHRYDSNAVGIMAANIARPRFAGFRIKYETQTDDRYVKPIAIRGCTDVVVEEIEAWNFTKSLGLIYFGNCQRVLIKKCRLHDCMTNSATTGQITGVEWDNDDDGSSDITITENWVWNLTVGASFLASFGYQTDGFNGVRSAGATHPTERLLLTLNHAWNVGEGFDMTGQTKFALIANTAAACYNFNAKAIHNCVDGKIAFNNFDGGGISCIDLDGTNTGWGPTTRIEVCNNNLTNPDSNNVNAAHDTAGVRFFLNGGPDYPTDCDVHDNNIDCGAYGKYGVLGPAGSGANNRVRTNSIINEKVAKYLLDPTVVPSLVLLDKARFSATKNSVNQTGMADGAYTKLTFATEAEDVGGYYDNANSKWTPPQGPVRITVNALFSGLKATGGAQVSIYKNGSAWANGTYGLAAGGFFQSNVTKEFMANGTDYFEAYGYVDATTTGTAIGSDANTFFQGEQL